jgi:hypothetical protein
MSVRTLSTLFVLGVVSAQTTWIVDAGGNGNFRDLPPAVAAAQAGDVLVVRAGLYNSFTVGKGLRIVGDPGVMVNGQSIANIVGVPAGETCLVRGLANGAFAEKAFLVQDCLGHVHLEGMVVRRMDVLRSRQVTLHGLRLDGAPALLAEDSTVHVVQCTLAAALSVLTPTHALVVVRSVVTFAHGTATGGTNYSGVGAGSGVELRSGTLVLAGDAATVVAGGSALIGSATAPAIVTLGGAIVRDPAVALVPRGGALPIVGPAAVAVRPVPSLRANVSARTLTVAALAPPGQTVHLLAGAAYQPPVTLPFGDLWVGWPLLVLSSAVVPPSGTQLTSLNLPPLAPAALVTLQSLVQAGSQLELSVPVTLTVDA